MPDIICLLFAVLAGTVQGIAEWLPISSTGHLILLESLFEGRLDPTVMTAGFKETFDVVVQFGSIMAIAALYFGRLNPFAVSKSKKERRETQRLWWKILIASLPAGIVGILFDDKLSGTVFRDPQVRYVVAAALFLYGVLFIVIERKNKNRIYAINDPEGIGFKTALGVGAFQILALIPGTSRSGSTVIGSMLLGVSRKAAAEFSFFLAIPVMFGASVLKIAKFIGAAEGGIASAFNSAQLVVLATGTAVSFLVSLAAVKFLVGFVRRHSFEGFGWYRIALGLVVVVYFAVIK